jgi:hypothetical protein
VYFFLITAQFKFIVEPWQWRKGKEKKYEKRTKTAHNI